MRQTLFISIAVAIITAALSSVLYLAFLSTHQVQASVTTGQEYNATTTAASTAYGSTITNGSLIKKGYGSLGSIVITGANTGIVNIYNATTTDVTKRAASMATSTILIASLPASLAAGTYTFDATFNNGLYLDLISGSMPTSTITYR